MHGDERARQLSLMRRTERNRAFVNGALVAAGLIAVVDNVVAHWLLGLHRAVPGPLAGTVEAALVGLGVVILFIGVWREATGRRKSGP